MLCAAAVRFNHYASRDTTILHTCWIIAASVEAMMNGEGDVVSGFKNKVMTTVASVTPSSVLAEQHKKKAAPGSGKE
jgi:hypothetical protein